MLEKRLKLQSLLEDTIGSRNVYFQPPENIKLNYPCIIYERGDNSKPQFANNVLYQNNVHYVLMVIDRNPDSEILAKVQNLPLCKHERHYISNNLNHDVYNIYY